MDRKLLVTHHAPDLDAIGAVWMLKRFDAQHFASAHVAFVNPGEKITLEEAEKIGFQPQEATHVDTGLGKFDHHQPEHADPNICATSLTYDYVLKIHPQLKNDKALQIITKFVTQIDHFGEIYWDDASNSKYNFMIHELIRGLEFFDPHSDESQLHFGIICLDSAYATLIQQIKAKEIIAQKGKKFDLKVGKALALETKNDDTIKIAQKMGFALVIRKDPKMGHIRIKARPDTNIDLKTLHERILAVDHQGTWFYHNSGRMLINGSRKHRNQIPSPLTLSEIITMIKEIYG